MIGRKLLLADDSVTIQKVIALTFADEGMEIRTVGNGERAVQVLEEFTPDIVLADVIMPGLDGYRLCEFIKNSEKFHQIPVMLLVGSFEPFDEAEARRVGADDFVTKPFQSIRHLVNRVGSLLSGQPAKQPAPGGFSTLGLGKASAPPPAAVAGPAIAATPAFAEPKECDLELQTADTLRLKPLLTAPMTRDDVLLDLDDFDTIAATTPDVEDSILDLEYIDAVELASPSPVEEFQSPSFQLAPAATVASEVTQEYERVPEFTSQPAETEWAISEERTIVGEVAEQTEIVGEAVVEPRPSQAGTAELSPEVIDAIAERVVEKLSDQVVREIAWEVVPELAELLIKRRLEEQQH